MQKEAKARILINDLLQRSRWRFFDDETGPANITLETHVKLKKKTLEEFGDDFDKTANGYVDYLLLDERGFPIAVLEAKSEERDPLVGKEHLRSQSVTSKTDTVQEFRAKYFGQPQRKLPLLYAEHSPCARTHE